MKMHVRYGSVYFPHINYTVRLRRFKPPPDSIGTAMAWAQRDDKWGCTIYLPKVETPGDAAHEFIHALQWICQDREMLFEREFEHMAYMMQHLMGRVFGYEWVKKEKKRGKRKRPKKAR